jgi:hypothetical protein
MTSPTHWRADPLRRPDRARAGPGVQAGPQAKYALSEGDRGIVSTVGGGGDQQTSEAFSSVVGAVHRLIHPSLPRLRHLMVRGPKFRAPLRVPTA